MWQQQYVLVVFKIEYLRVTTLVTNIGPAPTIEAERGWEICAKLYELWI